MPITDAELVSMQHLLDALPSQGYFFDDDAGQLAFDDEDGRRWYISLEVAGGAEEVFLMNAPRDMRMLLAEVIRLRAELAGGR